MNIDRPARRRAIREAKTVNLNDSGNGPNRKERRNMLRLIRKSPRGQRS